MTLQSLVYFFVLFVFVKSLLNGDRCSNLNYPCENGKDEFVWTEALNVMSYHRSKMNEYLCKNYIASEIVEKYKNQSEDNVEKRVGKPLRNSRLARESLLEDPGSQKYKDWLSRSNTLEDIYHHFEHSENDHGPHQETSHGNEGEVTGYALVGHKHLYAKPSEYEGDDGHYIGSHYEDDEHEEKGMKLKELFHFALTAIAFLAFATFMIEIIMCLMEVPGPVEPDYVLIPTSTGGTGDAEGTGATGHAAKTDAPVNIRQERSLELNRNSVEMLNIMSSKVLSSIEALTILHEDDGECLRRALCQNSEYSKTLSGIQKIWLPLWSFGTSWIAKRLTKEDTSAGDGNTLGYLKAAVMGLGTNKCHALYPKCDGRKRNRKKRKTDI